MQRSQANIQDSDNKNASVTKNMVSGPDGIFSASGWWGFDRRNQNRVDHSAVPFFGKLSEPRYDKEDSTEYNRLGEVRIDDSTLAIVSDENATEKLAEIRMIAVLNQDQAYET